MSLIELAQDALHFGCRNAGGTWKVDNFDFIANPANKSTGSTAKLKPVARVLDAYTLEVTLGTPESSFLTLIAAPYFGIVSKQQLEQDPKSLASKLIGTGPFRFDRWVKGQSLTYVRNADYDWAPPKFHRGTAYVDSVRYVFLPEDQTRYNALLTGEAFLAGISACGVTLVQGAAKEAGIPLEKLTVAIEGARLKSKPADFHHVDVHFTYRGPNQAQAKELTEIWQAR